MFRTSFGILFTYILFVGAVVAEMSTVDSREYLLTSSRPDKVHIIDASNGEIVRELIVPQQTMGSWSIIPSKDGKYVYVTTNNHESVIGLDMESGEVLFKADLSEPTIRMRSFYGHDLSEDGSRLYVHVNPVKMHLDRLEVLDNEILVFDTSSGVNAKPLYKISVPRRIQGVMSDPTDKYLYLLGRDYYKVDVATGEVLETYPINSWSIDNRSPGDVGGHWMSFEKSGIYTQAVYSVHLDRDPYTLEAYQTGIVQLDRDGGLFNVFDFENTSDLIFATTSSPTKPEVYGVYNTLLKVDSGKEKTVKRIPLEATYYSINVSENGERVYIGGGGCKVAAHQTSDLSRLWGIDLPGCSDQSFSHLRVISQ
jgi:quinohemoprotein amine dehydrogenase beta subunit